MLHVGVGDRGRQLHLEGDHRAVLVTLHDEVDLVLVGASGAGGRPPAPTGPANTRTDWVASDSKEPPEVGAIERANVPAAPLSRLARVTPCEPRRERRFHKVVLGSPGQAVEVVVARDPRRQVVEYPQLGCRTST